MKKTLAIFITAAIIIAGGAFYGGMKYGQKQALPVGFANFANRQFDGGATSGVRRGNGQMASGFINGEIIAKDDKSITVKLRDGGSKIVFFAAATQIMKSVDGTTVDLQNGENVMVSGQSNSDGSITAQTIQLRPALPVNATSTPQEVENNQTR